jgi:hypothetical protein
VSLDADKGLVTQSDWVTTRSANGAASPSNRFGDAVDKKEFPMSHGSPARDRLLAAKIIHARARASAGRLPERERRVLRDWLLPGGAGSCCPTGTTPAFSNLCDRCAERHAPSWPRGLARTACQRAGVGWGRADLPPSVPLHPGSPGSVRDGGRANVDNRRL